MWRLSSPRWTYAQCVNSRLQSLRQGGDDLVVEEWHREVWALQDSFVAHLDHTRDVSIYDITLNLNIATENPILHALGLHPSQHILYQVQHM